MKATILIGSVVLSSFYFTEKQAPITPKVDLTETREFLTEDSEFIPTDSIIPDASLVDFDAFLKLAEEAKLHRSSRMLSVEEFKKMAPEENTIILDARSKAMYDSMHVKGAIHINFADFHQRSLYERIPDLETNILIYCNNNFMETPKLVDQSFFVSKMAVPNIASNQLQDIIINPLQPLGVTMALNIPTYINLYGYGYRNIFELKDMVYTDAGVFEFEGTAVASQPSSERLIEESQSLNSSH